MINKQFKCKDKIQNGSIKVYNKYFVSLKANFSLKICIKVTSFLNNPRPLDDQYTFNLKVKFLIVQMLLHSQEISTQIKIKVKIPHGSKVVAFTRNYIKFMFQGQIDLEVNSFQTEIFR